MPQSPVVLITGCSTGIGFETALLLAREGFQVFATMRDLKKAAPLRQAAQGLPLEILALDVDQPASARKCVSLVLAKAGRIDVLVNNAGWGAFGALEEFTDKEVLAQYETNVFGMMRVTRAVLPSMRKQKSGKIIHIGSLAGRMTFGGISLYCSTKYAVEALTESLRLELRPFGVQVAVVEPGSIKTPFKANRRKAGAFLQKKSVYQEVLEKILFFGDHPSALAPGPKAVAGKILKALKSRKLSARYRVGLDSIWFPVVRWALPSFAYDWLMKRVYGKFLRGTHPFSRPQSPPDKKRVVLVTGANSGFGLETVRVLARRGLKVYGTYRKKTKSTELFGLARGGSVFPLLMDVTQNSSVRKAVEAIRQREGRLDALVNNAGFVVAGFLEDLSEKELRSQFETNVFGILRVARAALPLMRRSGGGTLLNIGSISGRVSFPGIGAYAASKHSVRSLSEGLRMELRPFGIQVGEIAPGTFATKVMSNTQLGEGVKKNGSPYASFARQVEAMAAKEFTKAAPASQVAEMVGKILDGKKVNPVYLAGTDAKVLNTLKKVLPDSWFESLFSRFFPWSREYKNEGA